jgi:hypothetical protein
LYFAVAEHAQVAKWIDIMRYRGIFSPFFFLF